MPAGIKKKGIKARSAGTHACVRAVMLYLNKQKKKKVVACARNKKKVIKAQSAEVRTQACVRAN